MDLNESCQVSEHDVVGHNVFFQYVMELFCWSEGLFCLNLGLFAGIYNTVARI